MYHASKSSECVYCTLHVCAFMLRRGVPESTIVSEIEELPVRERHIARAARAVAQTPPTMKRRDREVMRSVLSRDEYEACALACAMMGYLNSFMAVSKVNLEQAVMAEAAETASKGGWSLGKVGVSPPEDDLQKPEQNPPRSDSVAAVLPMLVMMPILAIRSIRLVWSMPTSWPEIGKFLQNNVGCAFSVLAQISSRTVQRSLCWILLNNLLHNCALSVKLKGLAGVVVATYNQSDHMREEFTALARAHGCDDDSFKAAGALVDTDISDAFANYTAGTFALSTKRESVCVLLARLCSSSPPGISQDIVAEADRQLCSAEIVEIINWIAILHLLVRLHAFYIPNSP
mmetsp:Transcript_9661/g.29337  ORF Transcript_9661/g.29337 Transcript_9661/m.29337 type:complete len:345 (-) Transcript_9661:174-1208(-)